MTFVPSYKGEGEPGHFMNHHYEVLERKTSATYAN